MMTWKFWVGAVVLSLAVGTAVTFTLWAIPFGALAGFVYGGWAARKGW